MQLTQRTVFKQTEFYAAYMYSTCYQAVCIFCVNPRACTAIKILSRWQHVICMWQSRAPLTWFLGLYSARMYMYCIIIMKVSGM